MILLPFLLFFLCLLATPAIAAETLDVETLLQRSARHLPTILSAKEGIAVRKGAYLQAEGAFDPTLESDTDSRATGFYDGRSSNLTLRQPMQDFGAELYSRYRISDGVYPDYEGDLDTQTGGEVAVGAVFSLLRNRDTDTRRTALIEESLRVQEAELEYELTQLTTQFAALLAYWDWLARGMEYRVYQEILALADDRQSALEKEVSAGNRASMFLIENRQNILKRQAALRESRRQLLNAAEQLSFYYRDDMGKPLRASDTQLPESMQNGWLASQQARVRIEAEDIERLRDRLAEKRPDIQRFATQIKRFEQQRLLGENQVMPQLDVMTEVSQDMGRREMIREDTESRIKLALTIPLQTRLGRGQIAAAEAQIRQLSLQKQALEQQLQIELDKIANDLRVGEDVMAVTAEEVSTATQLLEAERVRFRDGASDFFLLNLREETLAEARLRNIQAIRNYLVALSQYATVTMQKGSLGLKNDA